MWQDCCNVWVTSRISVVPALGDPHVILTVCLILAASRHFLHMLVSYLRHLPHLLALYRVMCGYLMSPGWVFHQKVKKLLASHLASDRQFWVYYLSQAHRDRPETQLSMVVRAQHRTIKAFHCFHAIILDSQQCIPNKHVPSSSLGKNINQSSMWKCLSSWL